VFSPQFKNGDLDVGPAEKQPITGTEGLSPPQKTLRERCLGIDWLVLDVDGVLSDGGIIYADDGCELKQFHVRDGSGLKIWQYLGKKSAILTGRTSAIVDHRAAEVGVEVVIQGATDKMPAYRQLLQSHGVRPEQVCYVGDDVPDLPVMRNCGLAVAVADACPDVLAASQYVTRAAGGRGAVRESLEMILRCQDLWQKLFERLSHE
jgi:3-deoxy-D-manno-octulosonate 8-phosphate phosphatase (KDO 8-P phosphatase)